VLDVGEALSDLGNLLRRLLGVGVSLNICHGRDVALVKVDRVQLEQVVMNLAVNARDAMDGRGELEIPTRMKTVEDTTGTLLEPMPAGDYVRIDVTDKGAGIDPVHLACIFEPFFTTKPLGEGTGLGLSTVYGIVKPTGGFIFVDSKIGERTMFFLYLPPHEETPEEAVKVVDERTRDLTGMLVEDEDPVRPFGARALLGKGYRVIGKHRRGRAEAVPRGRSRRCRSIGYRYRHAEIGWPKLNLRRPCVSPGASGGVCIRVCRIGVPG
jgi:two-component system cell cycle sensor histidine kinase/response regulator CckA